jgi:hypothetical protein
MEGRGTGTATRSLQHPDIKEVSDRFDEEYDQAEYETKIAGLIHKARNRARHEDRQEDVRDDGSVTTEDASNRATR